MQMCKCANELSPECLTLKYTKSNLRVKKIEPQSHEEKEEHEEEFFAGSLNHKEHKGITKNTKGISLRHCIIVQLCHFLRVFA